MRRRYSLVVGCTALLFCCTMLALAQQVSTTAIAGGRGGNQFSDYQPAAGARVSEVRIQAGDTIDSVQMVYALTNGQVTVGPRHGGSGGRPATIQLDTDEYIIAIAGRYGDTIDSLRIITNKRQSQTFGGRGGDRDFRIEVPAGYQATGFTGRAGDTIDAIGLVCTQITRRRSVFGASQDSSGGPGQTQLAGGGGGRPFADQDIPSGARITEIRVRAGDTIDAIQAVYQLPDGRNVESTLHGGGGGRLNTFRFDSDEYLLALAGRYGDTIDSLSIITNKRQSQVFGGRGGDRNYRIEVPQGNEAIGFAGRAGDTVNAIGLVYAQYSGGLGASITNQLPWGQSASTDQRGQTQIAGGSGGRNFADQNVPSGARITEIRVRAGDTVEAIQAVHLTSDGRYLEATLHGGSSGRGRFMSFRLDSDEYLVALAGRSSDVINSLTIITNKRQSQVFGGSGGNRDFRIEVPQGGQAVGFIGRAGTAVNAIGLVYDQYSRRRNTYSVDSSTGQYSTGQGGQTQLAGGNGGRPFADQNVPSGAKVAEIRVRAGDSIDAIQAVYLTPDGSYIESAQHGGGGGRLNTFRLDSDEYLVAIAGRCGNTVVSLYFITNKRQSQVFGGRGGDRDYRLEVPQGNQAIGFIGRAGNTVDAIGLVFVRTGYRR
jgi:hypothetical protein